MSQNVFSDDEYISVSEERDDGSISEHEEDDDESESEPNPVWVVDEGLRLLTRDTLEAFRGRQPSLQEHYLRLRAQMMPERQNAFNKTPTQQARCRACAQQDKRSTL
jgi:hypothetical protein